MGYLSEVSITMFESDFENLVLSSSKNMENGAFDLLKRATLYREKAVGSITLFWDYVKWYDSYESIAFIMNFIRNNQYQFRRVGEGYSDIEDEYNDDDWVLTDATYIERYINVECAGEETNIDSLIREILHKKIAKDDDSEIIEDISEEELFNLIGA